MHTSCKLITSELQFQSVLAFLYANFREFLPVFFVTHQNYTSTYWFTDHNFYTKSTLSMSQYIWM